jgi:hypothetical protein
LGRYSWVERTSLAIGEGLLFEPNPSTVVCDVEKIRM